MAGVVVIGLVVVLIVALGGNSPSDAVRATVAAVEDRDLSAFQDSLCKDDRDAIQDMVDSGLMSEQDLIDSDVEIGSWEIVDEVITGDRATVTVKDSSGESEIPVLKEDGDWKVCTLFSEGI